MIRRMTTMVRSRMALLAAGVLLAAGGLALVPAASASASTDGSGAVEAWFSGGGTGVQLCSSPGTGYYNAPVVEIYNPCGYRVWIHYVSGSTVQSYCVNPGGGLAYDLPITWAGGDSSDIQLTTNAAQCDNADGDVFELFTLTQGSTPLPMQYNCLPSYGKIFQDGYWIYELMPVNCNFRIWLHQNTDGSGKSLCIDPGYHYSEGTYVKDQYQQLQVTNVQAPCSAGGAPYPI
jgi:hypothetical protein